LFVPDEPTSGFDAAAADNTQESRQGYERRETYHLLLYSPAFHKVYNGSDQLMISLQE
jgi:hypothetical protein